MTLQATRYHDISVGHRVHEHRSKCQHLHGHNYRIFFTLETAIDSDMVLDFGIIKELFCEWLEECWDHRFLVFKDDPWAIPLAQIDKHVLLVPFNPTAENMAKYLLTEVANELLIDHNNVKLVKVVVEETRKCSASYEVK